MKRYGLIVLMLLLSFYFMGCGKKEAQQELGDTLTMESISTVSGKTQPMPQTNISPAAPESLESLPPGGPYRPTAIEIQTALKNAGYYTGTIDGKIGPMSKKAIEEFQNANNLEVDGKVGPRTWAVLKEHLSIPLQGD